MAESKYEALMQAADQFIASCNDGNVRELLEYYEEIFREALADLELNATPVVSQEQAILSDNADCAKQETHERLATAVLAHGFQSPEVDAALAECPNAECQECGWIACPHADTLHFHHDGCPSCEQVKEGLRG